MTLNQCQPSAPLSNTVHIPKNENHYLAITTQSGNITIHPFMPIVDKVREYFLDIDDVAKVESKKLVTSSKLSQKFLGVDI